MLGGRIVLGRSKGDEAEKPFWISFSDLMTALMVLFLLVMTVSLLTVTEKLRDVQKKEAERSEEIARLMADLAEDAKSFPHVHVATEKLTIDFGVHGHFETASDRLPPETEDLLRTFVPKVLARARTELGRKWFRRVVVEGFTDTDGTYLYNLDLSLRRAERVVCTILTPAPANRPSLSSAEMEDVRRLFLVGGFSFNSTKESKQESRRVELRLDFRAVGEIDRDGLQQGPVPAVDNGKCHLRTAS